jgi:hypothetical protein
MWWRVADLSGENIALSSAVSEWIKFDLLKLFCFYFIPETRIELLRDESSQILQ